MADEFLFNILEKVLIKVTSPSIENLSFAWGMKSELNKLQNTLSIINAVFLDQNEQKTLNHQAKDWLHKLREVVYDADDLLDEMSTESLRRNIDKKHGKTLKRVRNLFSCSNPIVFRFKMGRKLRNIRNHLDQITADWRKFRSSEINPSNLIGIEVREQTHSYVKASEIVGRENDKRSVVEQLILENSTNAQDNVSVLPIVGLGGLGKTTLVKMVYNDVRISEYFDLKMWVCVSEDFSLKQIIEKILRSTTGERHDHLDMDQIQIHLRTVLDSKRYLLVLDDVWNDDRNKWTELRDLLVNGSSGSKIIVTTRSKKVATITGTVPAYNLSGLFEDDCLSLFLKCAFGRDNDFHPKLAKIGKDIVNKCGGVPLAIKTLGNLLYSKTDERQWLQIRDNEIWQIEQKENDILPILRLSYDQMPSSLRQCFTYCSTFPKGSEIPREEFINLWTAQGFIEDEDVGDQYFNELISKFCFQDVVEAFDGDIVACHNLVQDLAQSMAGDRCSSIKIDSTKAISEGTRHVLFQGEDSQGKQVPEYLLKTRKLQTFNYSFKVGPNDKNFVKTVSLSFRCLRVLSMNYLQIVELPKSIGKLKLLRYLNLNDSPNLTSLPRSICKLVNLQTLSLINCENLQSLPKDIKKLVNLRTLYLTSLQQNLPVEKLLSLDSLQIMLLYKCSCISSMLPSSGFQVFSNLRVLRIYDCPRLTNLTDSMKYLSNLEKLWIWNCKELDLSLGTDVFMKGLTSLRSLMLMGLPKLLTLPEGLKGNVASNLHYLLISDCQNLRNLPDWIHGFTSLVNLYIEHCPNLLPLPEGVGLLSAKLKITGCPLVNVNGYA
ncbi:putative disease resistance protein RGA3 [Impatiens glandulifera]|uniref:putative disease resistance protein RGA3 n=1 Tax=Impatiens glandulifera TaxID=253017 RepID=UPI001FB16541|nr:putative disease resistance protein RGA3 [Impatiens glandulifera]